ncbi:MAG: hypothetical protein E7266_09510 [Lachnospiraceae bacterium]|nr:hypothetical protein [Lachnospiraceae bacterium]
MITPTSYGYSSPYSQYNNGYSGGLTGYGAGSGQSISNGINYGTNNGTNNGTVNGMRDTGECETCANRKYQDGSNEMVSFKTATHISPEAAGAAVRSHEQEHVSNAYKTAARKDGEVVNASVAIHTDICPECGRSYVSGGTTTTAIRYNTDPYAQNAKNYDKSILEGQNIHLSA